MSLNQNQKILNVLIQRNLFKKNDLSYCLDLTLSDQQLPFEEKIEKIESYLHELSCIEHKMTTLKNIIDQEK